MMVEYGNLHQIIKCGGGLNKNNMYKNRRILILPILQLNNVNWSQVITEQDKVQISLDNTKFYLEFDLPNYPDIYDSNTMTLYTQIEIALIINNIEWDSKYL